MSCKPSNEEQYDLPSDIKKLYEIKRQKRASAKEYYLKFLYNPHRPIKDGMPFDPALQRFSAMSAYHAFNYHPKARHWAGFIMYMAPFFGLAVYLSKYKAKQEALLRSGTVRYSDRTFKLIF